MKTFVTGAAGFIGFHLASRLLEDGHEVLGYDAMTPYYDVRLKEQRLEQLASRERFRFVEAMLEDSEALGRAIHEFTPDVVVHLAAQAGVRYSLEAPDAYISSNLVGTFNLLEVTKELQPRHLLIASTSSVYGGNEGMPFAEADRTDFPVSLYAATKKACEAMSHTYAHLWKVPTTCFRFFSVIGALGRPDMALFKFVDAIADGEPIDVYGEGQMKRDFTSVDDLIEAIVQLIDAVPVEGHPVDVEGVVDSLSPVAPWRVVNIGAGRPVGLMEFIEMIEDVVGTEAVKNFVPMQKGDVRETLADSGLLEALTGYVPSTPLEQCVRDFVEWHRSQHALL